MASTSATAQSYNDTNILGDVLQIGATRNTGQFLSAISANGTKRVNAQNFIMTASYALDAGSQNVIDESASLTAGTAQFYAKSQEYNVTQLSKLDIAVSDLRLSATQQLSNPNADIGGFAPTVSEFDRAVANGMAQFAANWEYSAINGTFVDRSIVTTDVAMGGLLDTTVGIQTNTEAAGGLALTRTHLNNLLITMTGNGAQLQKPALLCRPKYLPILSGLFGYQPADWNMGGVAIKNILTDFGNFGIIWTNSAPDNTLIVADLSYIYPVVLPQPNGQDVSLIEYVDGGSAQKGYIQGFISVDFTAESFHGKITGLA